MYGPFSPSWLPLENQIRVIAFKQGVVSRHKIKRAQAMVRHNLLFPSHQQNACHILSLAGNVYLHHRVHCRSRSALRSSTLLLDPTSYLIVSLPCYVWVRAWGNRLPECPILLGTRAAHIWHAVEEFGIESWVLLQCGIDVRLLGLFGMVGSFGSLSPKEVKKLGVTGPHVILAYRSLEKEEVSDVIGVLVNQLPSEACQSSD